MTGLDMRKAMKLCSYVLSALNNSFLIKKIFFRIGGDEFAYFYNKNKENNIGDKIAQLNQTLESTEHTFNYPLSISSGYACFLPEMDNTFKDLAKRSDLMLYRIKRKRKLAYAGSSELLTSNTLINAGTSAEEKAAERNLQPHKKLSGFFA